MHCDRCNVDFPEGLRYCKWCGESLVDRPRVTSELHSCPSCSAAIQPGWTFCKLCGERLHSVAREAGCPACGAETEAGAPTCLRCGEDLTGGPAGKIAPDPADSSVFAACSSCGEQLETGSLYCKGCGSAVYTEKPFGGSALLCGACNSYSPLGSRVCRVCGVPLVQGLRTVVDFPAGATTTIQQRAPTLPDLDQRLKDGSPLARADEEPTIESGANTITFSGAEPQTGTPLPRGAGETNMLPGTAGARSEQQAPTSVMHMGRITGPVDADEVPETSNTSGGLTNASATDAEPPAIHGHPVVGSEPTVEFVAGSRPPGPTTLGLGSESESEGAPASYENKTAVFVSPSHASPPPSREQLSRDDMGTKPFTPGQPTTQEPTREIEQPARRVTADDVVRAGQMTSAPQWTSAEPIGPTPTPEQSELQNWPVSEGASQPLPKRRTGVVIASVVVVLILLGASGYVGWLLFGRARPAPPVPPPVVVVTPEPPVIPEKPPAPVVPVGMVAVSVGAYTIGRDGADADPLERPAHKVDLPAFFIDRSEVTNAAYKNFVDTTHHKVPSNWSGSSFPEGRADFPVTGVTWQDAADYAAWAGKRLPTEAEWEAAARGADGRLYPWGNDWRLGVANVGLKPDKPTPEQYPTGLREAGRYPQGASPAGAVDMIGNAWEWVADEINVYPGSTESTPDLESGVTYRVIRGGAYDGSKVNDATYRGYLDGSQPYPKVGFRCAKDAK